MRDALLTNWSYIFPLLISVTILLNWRQNPYGWLLGFFAQMGNVVVSQLREVVAGFSLSLLPGVLFLLIFVRAMRTRREKVPT